MTVWTGSAEFNPLIDPRHFMPFSQGSSHHRLPCPLVQLRRRQRFEPTGDLRTTIDLYEAIKATPDVDEHKRLFQQILVLNKENLWTFSMAVGLPAPGRWHKKLPPAEGVSSWHLQTPGSTVPEQVLPLELTNI